MIAKEKEKHTVVDVAPELVSQWVQAGQVILVDVREDFEHSAERIPGAQHHPLSRFESDELREHSADKRIVFFCQKGQRSHDAARRFQSGNEPVFWMAGGIEGWRAAGLKTIRTIGPRIDVMRQTQITTGSLVLIGVLLGAFVSPWFLALSGFIGAGLVFAGASGTCGMAIMLAKLPWNRVSRGCQGTCSLS